MNKPLRSVAPSGHAETGRIACRSCGNLCRPPTGTGVRAYLCPRCRRPLRVATGRRGEGETRRTKEKAEVALSARRPVALSLLSRLAPIACVLAVLLVARQALVMPASGPARASRRLARVPAAPAVRKPFSAAVERNYRFRVRQLESDLARDPREYLLLARLGLLYARLAGHTPTPAQAGRDLDAALEFFSRATRRARTRRDYDWAVAQREAYSERGFVNDETDTYLHPDLVASPPPRSDYVADQLLMRVQFLEMLVKEMPDSARLRCRLGLTYVRLGQALASRARRGVSVDRASARQGERATKASSPRLPVSPSPRLFMDGPLEKEPSVDDCRRRAREELGRALRQARCREIRAEGYRALAELHRAADDPVSCLGMLRRVVELQPNNWPAQLHVATLLARLGRPEEARRARALGERWRTPEWM